MEPLKTTNREIDSRSLGGITVSLYWREDTTPPEWFVTYNDARTGDEYVIESANSPEPAHEVFNHPNIYREFASPLYVPESMTS
jgi:hypothetical protein